MGIRQMFASGALLPCEVLSVKQAEVAPLSAVQQQRGKQSESSPPHTRECEEGVCFTVTVGNTFLNPARAKKSLTKVLTEVRERVLVEIRCADVAREVTIAAPAVASEQVRRGTRLRRGRCAVCDQVRRAYVPLH